jgi:spore germination protein YaaH
MTAAVGSWFGDRISTAAIQAFDFINVMAYDLHNPFAATEPVQSASIEEATAEVQYWVGRGLSRERAVFGVPFYGFKWVAGKSEALTYAQILAGNPAAETSDQVDLSGAVTHLNSRTTIVAKAQLAKQYGGIMVWELGQDAPGDASLLKAIADATR